MHTVQEKDEKIVRFAYCISKKKKKKRRKKENIRKLSGFNT